MKLLLVSALCLHAVTAAGILSLPAKAVPVKVEHIQDLFYFKWLRPEQLQLISQVDNLPETFFAVIGQYFSRLPIEGGQRREAKVAIVTACQKMISSVTGYDDAAMMNLMKIGEKMTADNIPADIQINMFHELITTAPESPLKPVGVIAMRACFNYDQFPF
ncbi:unnamed protein product, partial [Mesorhabditis spiculigera]